MTRSIVQIGSIPNPIGGISNHVWRLCHWLGDRCQLLDIHPGGIKYPLPECEVHEAPGAKLLRLPWLAVRLSRLSNKVAHIHFSELNRFAQFALIMPFIPKSLGLVLTLHHGDQEQCYKKLSRLGRYLVSRGFERLDAIMAVSEGQATLYRRILSDPGSSKVIVASSYIKPPKVLGFEPNYSLEERESIPENALLLLASGFAIELYCHEEAIKVVDQLRHDLEKDIHLVICLYGTKSIPYLNMLTQLASERPYVHLVWDLNLPAFLKLQARANVYLRPTRVDSFGIAVADSLCLGTPVVATDVCVRYPGASVYRQGEFGELLEMTRRLLEKEDWLQPNISDDSLPKLLKTYEAILCNKMS